MTLRTSWIKTAPLNLALALLLAACGPGESSPNLPTVDPADAVMQPTEDASLEGQPPTPTAQMITPDPTVVFPTLTPDIPTPVPAEQATPTMQMITPEATAMPELNASPGATGSAPAARETPAAIPATGSDPVAGERFANEVGLELVAEGLAAPIALESPRDGSGQLFIADQVGVVRILTAEGELLQQPFLDLRDRMVRLNQGYDERGLLGLAFHPDFAQNQRFFVYYSAPLRSGGHSGWDHTSHVSEFSISADDPNRADPASERIILQVDQPQSNHNAGQITFGPQDGYLYIPLGDGGGANDTGAGHPQGGNGQDRSTLLGSILRINVDQGDPYTVPADNPFQNEEGLEEIYAYGLRNPYKISFDAAGQHELFAADAGQNLWEEVNIIEPGGNYGWNLKEGTHCFNPSSPNQAPDNCPNTGPAGEPLLDPAIEYANIRNPQGGLGTVVIGGYVYRGSALPELYGRYIFGDWSSASGAGRGLLLAATRAAEGGLWEITPLAVNGQEGLGEYLLSFGQDDQNELYVLAAASTGPSGSSGKVYRLVPPIR